ncbi:TRPM8 channel-associated factor 2 isoform X3 [Alligator sinensis]|uniref:TRPM8 channel-associated factor 2 isoform X3 n=1 Tax=Alligator sinensis TaxID=38654 RepID=A0A3Q0FN26_ALLSI|nr:TRPM8 channel-associated factor 2 isoform X3 [Alligator sinensis]
MKPSAIYECLVGGIGQWDFTGDFVPCELLLTGEAAFPVLVSPQKQVLIAVSQFGKGRIVVVSHEEILKNSRFSQFLQNAVDWLRPSPGALVGVHRNFDSLSELLLGAGIKVQLGVGLIASSGVYCIDAYDDTQAKALVQFVKGGGGLLIGGQAWHWASQHGVDRVLFEFPGNRVTSMAGVYFTGNAVETGVFKVSKKIPEIPLTVSDQEADKIHTFVAEGGGLLIGGQAWYWASQHQDRAAVAEYPGNKILNHFGISILGMNIKADKYPAQLPMEHYHFRHALSLFQRHVDKEEPFQPPLTSWLQRLRQDCSAFLRIPAEDCPTYNSLHLILIKVLRRTGIPRVSKQCPVKSNSKEAVLLSLATELSQNTADCAALVQKPGDGVCLPPSTSRITVEIAGTNAGGTAWRSTGLYLPDGSTAVITLPCTAISAGLQVQIGCHSDDLTNAKELMRAPVVIRKCQVNCQNQSVSCLWGGLIYIVVPGGSQLGKVPIAVEGAIKAPFFRLGETCKRQWQTNIRHYPAPWAELATENLILTVPADNIRHVENPEPLLTLWDQITWAIATLAAAPAKFPRPERIVTDVQISAGWMHAGYPIMGHLDSVKEMVNVEHMRTTGLWGPIHELGHNQQRAGWEFPPHTTEATCNLWSVYVHEKVLGIPRNKAHEALRPACRKERIKGYLEEGAQLKDWSVWTALETYLQLQEGFGWEPFIALFSEYQKILTIPKDNPSKMNMWAQKFSLQVNKNLAPFFMAWGWPIKNEVSSELATLPVWEENPMKKYIPVKI